jgi:hypothetical protein
VTTTREQDLRERAARASYGADWRARMDSAKFVAWLTTWVETGEDGDYLSASRLFGVLQEVDREAYAQGFEAGRLAARGVPYR